MLAISKLMWEQLLGHSSPADIESWDLHASPDTEG